jgi:peroxiredoxin family protein
VLHAASLALRNVASEKNNDGMKIGACQPTCPVFRVVSTCQTQDIRPSCHSLAKFLGKTREGIIV